MDKKTLIENLNHDLAEELSAVIQYTTYAAKTTGPYRPQLMQFFLALSLIHISEPTRPY